jgi:hypothetical protein
MTVMLPENFNASLGNESLDWIPNPPLLKLCPEKKSIMKNKLALFVALIGAALLTGCVSTYEVNNMVSAKQKLKPGGSSYIAIPSDASFEGEAYPGSGNKTALALGSALKPHTQEIKFAPVAASYKESLDAAKSSNADYFFAPRIVHWENRATEWSGKCDRIHIELHTIDARTGETIDVGHFKGVSKWLTFGGDEPEDLLRVPMAQYVNYLFGAPLPKK